MVHPNDNANDHPQTYDADDSGIRSGKEVLDIDASDERRPVTHRIVNGPDEYRYYVFSRHNLPKPKPEPKHTMKVHAQPSKSGSSGCLATWKLSDPYADAQDVSTRTQPKPEPPLESAPQHTRPDHGTQYSPNNAHRKDHSNASHRPSFLHPSTLLDSQPELPSGPQSNTTVDAEGDKK